MRGLAALYVVFGHTVFIATGWEPPRGRTRYFLQSLLYGQIAVAVFIVLSGYCLSLPCLRQHNSLRLDWRHFCRNRAWRILPPYYAALLASVVLAAVTPSATGHGLQFGGGDLVSHLLLLHDLHAPWSHAINSPLWSVAVEWHIYFLFAFALFPTWRWMGITAALTVAFAMGALPHFLLPAAVNLDWSHPWYLGLFALGMLAAQLTERGSPARLATVVRGWNGPLLLAAAILLLATYTVKAKVGRHLFLLTDTLEGLAAALLIVRFERQRQSRVHSRLLRLIESPVPLALGAVSFSLYLFHWPVLVALNAWVGHRFAVEARSWLLLMVGSPLAVAVAFVAYLTVERPLIAQRRRSAPAPADVAIQPTNDPTAALLLQP